MKQQVKIWLLLGVFLILAIFGFKLISSFESNHGYTVKPPRSSILTNKNNNPANISSPNVIGLEQITSPKRAINSKHVVTKNKHSQLIRYRHYNHRLVIKKAVGATYKPGSTKVAMKINNKTEWSNSTNMLLITGYTIIAGDKYWQVILPMRPNGTLGWIKNSYKVQEQAQTMMIKVNRKNRTVTLLANNKVIKTFPTVVGASRTPTPTGIFAARDVFSTNPQIFTGSHMIVTTGYSNALKSFDGGEARVALHGRGPTAQRGARLGTAGSNGCLRLDDKAINYIALRVRTGTPIIIV